MRAFEGIRVLDFTHVYAGPFASYQLAVMGAEVIKIESPRNLDMVRTDGADSERTRNGLSVGYLANNQGKKSICLDLTRAEGCEIARQLIESADVLVENYTHGLASYGLGAQMALAINPKLIYCSLTGFGSDNEFSGRPAYDTVIQAFSGMMSVNGEPAQPRMRVGPPLIDYGTGAQAAFAIATALYQSTRTGKGQVIEVNMLDAALMMMSPLVLAAIDAGKTPARMGNLSHRPGYGVFACSDDAIMVGAYTFDQHQRLFSSLKLDSSIIEQNAGDVVSLFENADCLRREMQQCFEKQDTSHWELRLNEDDVPAARVRDLYEMLKQEQLQRAPGSQFHRLQDSPLTAPIAAFTYASDGPEFDDYCARAGQDTDAVLGDIGLSSEQIEVLRESGVI
ncbi:MAG: CaiB/BaiF CoA-transferase family protein [Gammaproteobacteria bacterium]|nr:CaiB/BaiF CoA-transferase family protein [Gammaproteobacteria bacterium]MCZ6578215.1 CaiB/BaiF CoA-transferase family protein [Gammaproteobacteria bacterium]MCZ6723354.1 CaiB/BaiF CoA-transferase family protein [Gammaproteobacteria bacterium]MCZ6797990.1 CaiB/BaiF CoA-transferase family protein [Gammaproteobacteria bacterium]